MTTKNEVADALYGHIIESAKELTEEFSGDTVARGLEHLANAYSKVAEVDSRGGSVY